jgi:hypothetical protein
MQIYKANTAAVITIILMMAFVTLMVMPVQAQYTNMQEGGSVPLPAGVIADYAPPTWAYISFRPNPVGIDQVFLVNIWICPSVPVDRYFTGYTVTITKPDGTKDVIKMNSYQGDATAWFEYMADQLGTWKLKFEFPGGYFPAGNYTRPLGATLGYGVMSWNYSMYFKPAFTEERTLTVQEEQVVSWPPSPLPTDYWTRPVSPENREYFSILGDYPYYGPGGGSNWPANTNIYMSNYKYTGRVIAPNTAHIVWRRQGAISGLIGGDSGYISFNTGGGTPNIIFQGRAYQTVTKASTTNWSSQTYWQCYDLRTGELYWERPLFSYESAPTVIEYYKGLPAVTGGESGVGESASLVYIGGGRMTKYSPWTGAMTLNVSTSPLTTGTYYRNGYALTVQNLGTTAAPKYQLINWTTGGTTANFTARIVDNRTVDFSSLANVDYEAGVVGVLTPYGTDLTAYHRNAAPSMIGTRIIAYSLTTGKLLCNFTDPEIIYVTSTVSVDHGKLICLMQGGHYACYDLMAGKKLWNSEQLGYPWGIWGAYNTASYGGNYIGCLYDGVYAINWETGKIAWKYKAPAASPYEAPYTDENGQTVYSFNSGVSIADGKVYVANSEHSTSQPVTRGWKLHCINATTGEGIWNITGPMSPGPMADGYLTASNPYDGYMYVFGKGKSATTVTASSKTIDQGARVLIEGTVMDKSPGDQGSFDNPTAPLDSATAPGTVPCVSAASMETQMEYLYMQHPINGIWHNETITGVPVMLTAIGSDGSVTDIGTTTTNGYYGSFGYSWSPPKADTYTIIASFNGDDSYGSSSAATAVSVGPAPVTPSIPEITQPPDNTTLLYGILAAVAVAIVLALVAIIAIFRKR